MGVRVMPPVTTPPAPSGFVLVSGGSLPSSSGLGAVSVSTFYIGKTEVTWSEWKAVRAWAVANGYSDLANIGTGDSEKNPVTDANWYDVVKWCNARSQKEGKTPVYTVKGAVYKSGVSLPEVNTLANGYRLPSEREWEFAARGGTQTKGYPYSGSQNLNTVGWYGDNSGNLIHEVATKSANELGISDMSGNVWEWCSTGWQSALDRVIRGGDWATNPGNCTVDNRYSYSPLVRDYSVGFRVVLSSIP
jgi:formylglycine-generating enzyme required for sulfatase activity